MGGRGSSHVYLAESVATHQLSLEFFCPVWGNSHYKDFLKATTECQAGRSWSKKMCWTVIIIVIVDAH